MSEKGAYREVDPGSPTADIRAVRILIDNHVSSIRSLVHYSDVVPPGYEWTIPLELDCGFRGSLRITVDEAGDCPRAGEDEGERRSESEARNGTQG